MDIWFRPKRLPLGIALYRPVSWEGWFITIALCVLLAAAFFVASVASRSAGDTMLTFIPALIVVGIIFDVLCFVRGEYPSWWGGGPNARRRHMYVALTVLTFFALFAFAQFIVVPIRIQSCRNTQHAAGVSGNATTQLIADRMCSPMRFLGLYELGLTLRNPRAAIGL